MEVKFSASSFKRGLCLFSYTAQTTKILNLDKDLK